MQGIFNLLLTIAFEGLMIYPAEYIIFALFYSACSTVMFLSYTICCSMIPQNLMRIKGTVRKFINEYTSYDFIIQQNMF